MTNLVSIGFRFNPLTALLIPEPLAVTAFANNFDDLRNGGVTIRTYPVKVQLLQPQTLSGDFQFVITGPPGIYTILASGDLATWTELGTATNTIGITSFTDLNAHLSVRKFYRAHTPH